MNILWIVNMVFPEAEQQINGNAILKNTGGWLLASSNELVKYNYINLSVACVSKDVIKLVVINGEKIKYYVIPIGHGNTTYNSSYEYYWKYIINDSNPDIVNIHGTEFSHSLAYLRACPNILTVLTIQGLSNQIALFHNAGLKNWDIIKNITFRDIICQTLFGARRAFSLKGKSEKEIIQNVKFIIGRTTWDKSMSFELNPNALYFHCDESLRASFYTDEWSFNGCRPHTIFMSQASYPFKGVHQLIKALSIVVKVFPDTKVYISGQNILRSGQFVDSLKISGYGKYIKRLINQYKLNKTIEFIGFLDEKGIKKELLSSNVYLISSSIENSPNSLCEAQILGVPCIASFVGGINDFIPNQKHGELYRFEDYAVLALKIINVFRESHMFDNTEMRLAARNRHNVINNAKTLVNIYADILNLQK